MSFEIERKFLVSDDGWRPLVVARKQIRQAYLDSDGKVSIRVRINDNVAAALTIKSRPAEIRRLELEYPIPTLEAEALIALRYGAVIEKIRHIVHYKNATWEIDVFCGENAGLVIAEVELRDEHQHVELPPWIGSEITGQSQYYNSFLARRPYGSWADASPVQATR